MENFILAFITGLTTGGLSCLAVQGGLLASSVAQQVEQDLLQAPDRKKFARKKQPTLKPNQQGNNAIPILLFLASKLAAYSLLGIFLGWIGSMLQLSAMLRALLLILIGIFMLGNALRMFNVHPIFRYFSFEPPKAITRYIRRTARQQSSFFTPLFLGALTVLIPCGVTQTMMALAIGTGSPWQGMLIMFGFVLGTSPVFFAVAYLATRLGSLMEKYFSRFVAVVLLVVGLLSIESGLNLMGSPVSAAALMRTLRPQPSAAATVVPGENQTSLFSQVSTDNQTASTLEPDEILLNVTNAGYSPEVLHAPGNMDLQLLLKTENTVSCSRAFVIPALGIEKLLPATGVVTIDLPAQPAGSTLYFACSMGMYSGKIIFDL